MNTGKENIADAGIADLSNTIRRRRMRLVNYDYRRSGAYFVTICTHDRACMFGTVVDGTMALNAAGALVQEEWRRLPERFPHIFLDAHVVMPNHMHGIIVVDTDSRAPTRGVLRKKLRMLANIIKCCKYNWLPPFLQTFRSF